MKSDTDFTFFDHGTTVISLSFQIIIIEATIRQIKIIPINRTCLADLDQSCTY